MSLKQPGSAGDGKTGSAPGIDAPPARHPGLPAGRLPYGRRREHRWPYELAAGGSQARTLAGIDAPAPGPPGLTGARLAVGGDWRARAACRPADPDLFLPISCTVASLEQVTAAQAVCARCPVRPECLAFAQRARLVDGIWGGLTELERKHAAGTGQPAATGNSNDAATCGCGDETASPRCDHTGA